MGHELLLLGAALVVAGFLARAGRRIGLPTIPILAEHRDRLFGTPAVAG